MQQCAGARVVLNHCALLAIEEQLDHRIACALSLHILCARLDENADSHLLAIGVGALLRLASTIDADDIACNVEAGTGVLVVALHEVGIAVSDVVAGELEQKCETCALNVG